MEKILKDWLAFYCRCEISSHTRFDDMNFDIFDQAMTVDFVQKQFGVDVNLHDNWFETVGDLCDVIATRS